MERLNYNHLYYFYVVAKEGSIKATSEKLNVTQPTISDQIKLLEEYFEVKLFERRNRRLELTAEGELALKYSQKIFDLGNDLSYRLHHDVSVQKTSIDVGTSSSMSYHFPYAELIRLFSNDDIQVNHREDKRHILLAELEAGKIDLVFSDSKEALTHNMQAIKYGTNKTFAVAHKKYKKFIKTFPDCLSEIPYFRYTEDSLLRDQIDLFFTQYQINPKIIGEGDDVDLLHEVTFAGLGFTIVSELAKDKFIQDKEIIVLGEIEELESTLWGIIKNLDRGLAYQFLKNK